MRIYRNVSIPWMSLAACFVLISTSIFGHPSDDSTTISKGDKLISKLEDFSHRNKFFTKIADLFLIFDKEENIAVSETDNDPSVHYKKYTHKIIRHIDITVLNALGYEINRSSQANFHWWEKLGNSLHIKTQRFIIKNKLLFKENEKLNPLAISETERIIRQTNYIYDARIKIIELSSNPDSIDITILAQDIWSLTGSINGNPFNKTGYAEIKEINFLGLAHELRGRLYIDPAFKNGWNWEGEYAINPIGKTFLMGKLYHTTQPGDEKWGININRDFLSMLFTKAGGVNVYWEQHQLTKVKDTISEKIALWSNHQDIWFGIAKPIQFNQQPSTENNLILSTRIIKDQYSNEFENISSLYESRLFLLGGIAYAKRKFYKDNYLFGLGRTEDIPTGFLISSVNGYEFKKNDQSIYLGIRGGHGFYSIKNGFLYGGFQLASFYHLQYKAWEKTLFSTDLLYLSRLYNINQWKVRSVIWGRLHYFLDYPTSSSILTINNDNGIRGFSSDLIRGNQKAVLNYEFNIYPPVKLAGFRFILLAFTDLAMMGTPSSSILKSKLYQGYGIGIRFRNEHLIFSAVQLYIGIYPGANTSDAQQFTIYERGSLFYRFNQFQFNAPGVLSFE